MVSGEIHSDMVYLRGTNRLWPKTSLASDVLHDQFVGWANRFTLPNIFNHECVGLHAKFSPTCKLDDNAPNPVLARGLFNNGFSVLTRGLVIPC